MIWTVAEAAELGETTLAEFESIGRHALRELQKPAPKAG